MKSNQIMFICVLLFSSCSSRNLQESKQNDARVQYVNYLNEYWSSGDVSKIDSALKYNAYILESDSASITDYLYRIQMFDLCNRNDSILPAVNRIPQDMVSWPPEYKSYLRLKCKAIMAKEVGDTSHYRNCLDSIITIWNPVMLDSIAKTDTLLSLPMDCILDRYGYLIYSYILYYETLSILHGENFVGKILNTKKELYNWSEETFDMVREGVNGDAELAFP